QAEQHEFDDAVRQALQHSGFQAILREPRVLEVSRSGETGLVFCANVQRPGRDEATDVRVLLTALRLAEAGGFPGVLVISNLKYVSRPAYRFLEETTSSLRLVQRFELQRWVAWEVPLRDALVAA
ncbi:hypothetical protein, partial [Streptomyces swartbergensis]